MPPPPGPPEFCEIWAPAILPCSAWSTVTACARDTIVESTVAMLVPTRRRSVGEAVPVTTTSERLMALTESAASAVTVLPATTCTVRFTGW